MWRREDGDPTDLLQAHLRGDIYLGTHHGGAPTTCVMAVDIDGPSHNPDYRAEHALDALLAEMKRLHLGPALIATSRSGSGCHVYLLLAEPMSTTLCSSLMRELQARVARPELDKVYPSSATGDGLVLALPGCGLLGKPHHAVTPRGGRFVDERNLAPFENQLGTLAQWPAVPAVTVQQAAESLEKESRHHPHHTARPAASYRAPTTGVTRAYAQPLPVYDNELDVLARECAFIQEAARAPETFSYAAWFSLGTVLAVFSGGLQLFDAISRADARRFRPGEPEAKLRSVGGKPTHCRNLGWSCHRIGECAQLGVRSPAGLPYKLRRAAKAGGAV
jgi:hypothetical protein